MLPETTYRQALADSISITGKDDLPALVSVEFLGDSQSLGPAQLLGDLDPTRRRYQIDPVLGLSGLPDPARVDELIDFYVTKIADATVVVIGYCSGARLAERLAEKLVLRGKVVRGLVLIGATRPTASDVVEEFRNLRERLGVTAIEPDPASPADRSLPQTVEAMVTQVTADVDAFVARLGVGGAEGAAIRRDLGRRYSHWLWYLAGLARLPAGPISVPVLDFAASDTVDAADLIADEQIRWRILGL